MLDGIQKRLAGVLQPDRLRDEVAELLTRDSPDPGHTQALGGRLAETRRKIGLLVETLRAARRTSRAYGSA